MTASVQVHVVHAFTHNNAGGNPAGVVLNADQYTVEQKLHIAKAVGLSETAFVSQSDSAAFKLEFFTPNRQIAHCGHATVATFSLLRALDMVGEGMSSKETIDGNRDILIKADMAFMQQKAPRFQPIAANDHQYTVTYDRILKSMGLSTQDLIPGQVPTIVNTGNSFLLIPINSRERLSRIQPQQAIINDISEEFDLIGFYPFSLEAQDTGHAASTRMFAPRYGIDEEAATGMAAGPLACLLYTAFQQAGPGLQIEQGYLMQPASPSLIHVDLDIRQGEIHSLMAGGRARVEKTLNIDL
ncbi:PhzF family phenazine biosynthesis protein [Undibacterium sp. Ji49W]|uniref:PhzF family phenazine biosynthesis protein n=1 Tax=Undibacterium sp. Ji49W TaxID=3413040 RepID=UPI003BF16134